MVTHRCPICGRGYQTLEAAPVPFCSVACSDVARLVSALSPEVAHRPRLLRAVRCSYCQAPMQVAPVGWPRSDASNS
jgi:endogenous inhibitor of DNA gyrase (YacG/DUF329 family)